MTQDSTIGVQAIAPNLEFVFSNGREITMGRLGLGHVLKAGKTIARIWPRIEAIAANRDASVESSEDDTKQAAGIMLIQAILESDGDILDLIGPIFGMNATEMLDETKVQLADVPLMVEAIICHPDLAAFLKNFQGLAKSPAWTEMRTRIGANAKAPKVGKSN